jgi:ribosomal-protein-alanine N-acetyltransferase
MIELRPARVEDAAPLGEIGFAAWRTGRLGILDAGRTDPARLSEDFHRFCREEWDAIIVALDDGIAVGWGARESRDDYISDLWILPSAQGHGVGSALLARLETDIASACYQVARLNTRVGNLDAIRFYQRRGYVITAEVTEFSSSLNYEIPKFRLAKQLSNEAAKGEIQERTT